MNINPRFITYFQETFFQGKEEEFQEFLSALEKPIPRTIRIKPEKINEVMVRLEEYGFILKKTSIKNVFSIDRKEDFDPPERRIGFTPDHLVGNFYIQEYAAATSVEVLSGGNIHKDPFLILDMASSPGGKTTQLSEQYPNAFIIANEPTRERIPQLLQNLDRMGSANIGVTLYPGQYFRHSPETFDRILLDAPCSGEGTLYKGTLATKHWHLKNIKNIANLQEKLFEAALISLKVHGEMVYSTCSMNLLENEGVLENLKKKYPNTFKILFQKRYWPHIDGTGGFYVARLVKLDSITSKENIRHENPNAKIEKVHLGEVIHQLNPGFSLYGHEGKLLVVKDNPNLDMIREKYYFMRFGERIGQLEKGVVSYGPFSQRYISTEDIQKYELGNEKELDIYLRGGKLDCGKTNGPVLLTYKGISLALEEITNGTCSNNFPRDWQRK